MTWQYRFYPTAPLRTRFFAVRCSSLFLTFLLSWLNNSACHACFNERRLRNYWDARVHIPPILYSHPPKPTFLKAQDLPCIYFQPSPTLNFYQSTMPEEKIETIRIPLFGDPGVGKSCLEIQVCSRFLACTV